MFDQCFPSHYEYTQETVYMCVCARVYICFAFLLMCRVFQSTFLHYSNTPAVCLAASFNVCVHSILNTYKLTRHVRFKTCTTTVLNHHVFRLFSKCSTSPLDSERQGYRCKCGIVTRRNELFVTIRQIVKTILKSRELS